MRQRTLLFRHSLAERTLYILAWCHGMNGRIAVAVAVAVLQSRYAYAYANSEDAKSKAKVKSHKPKAIPFVIKNQNASRALEGLSRAFR